MLYIHTYRGRIIPKLLVRDILLLLGLCTPSFHSSYPGSYPLLLPGDVSLLLVIQPFQFPSCPSTTGSTLWFIAWRILGYPYGIPQCWWSSIGDKSSIITSLVIHQGANTFIYINHESPACQRLWTTLNHYDQVLVTCSPPLLTIIN